MVAFCFFSSTAYSDFLTEDGGWGNTYQEYHAASQFPPSQEYYSDYPDSPPVKKNKSYKHKVARHSDDAESYDYDLPRQIITTEKVIIVNPNLHAWGAYDAGGRLVRAGRATAGNDWCDDIGRGCKTRSGVFRIYSLGSSDCISSKYPIDEGGGAPMPYCMYFNGSQGIHGSNQVVEDNISHGCVRVRVSDARWIRYNFATVGTKVVVKPY